MTQHDALAHEVALANRIIERFGLSNAFGHVSARIPGTNTFLFPTATIAGIRRRGAPARRRHRGQGGVRRRHAQQRALDSRARLRRASGARLRRARASAGLRVPDADRRAASHRPQPGRRVSSTASRNTTASGLIRSRELGDLLAQSLGNHVAVMMRGHGITTVARRRAHGDDGRVLPRGERRAAAAHARRGGRRRDAAFAPSARRKRSACATSSARRSSSARGSTTRSERVTPAKPGNAASVVRRSSLAANATRSPRSPVATCGDFATTV